MHNKNSLVKLLMIAVFALTTAVAAAADLAGVRLSDTMNVGNTQLMLNGIALRTKYMFKIYVAGLYLARPSTNAAEIVETDAPKALVMQFVHDIKRDTMVEAYREGFANNAAGLLAKHQADVDRFLAFLPAVKEGDRLLFSYNPGKGSTFIFNGSSRLHIPGKAFSDIYLLVFIGSTPPTVEVKKGLLHMTES